MGTVATNGKAVRKENYTMIFQWIRKVFIDPLEFFPLLITYVFFKLLPLHVSSALGGKIARYIGPFLPVHKIGQQNLERAFPQKSARQREKILKGSWENLGRLVGEFPHLNKIARHYVDVIDHCGLTDLQTKKEAMIFFSAHMANWEIPHVVLTLRHMRISLLSRPPNNWLTRNFFKWVRYDPLVSIILKGGDGSKDLLRLLQNKGNLGILLDQRLSEGEKLPFFGHDAYTPVGPARLAEKFKATMIPVQIIRLKGPSFRIIYHAPLKLEKESLKTSLKINKIFEEWIMEHPDQWLWFHNRWKL